jgi:hypothetical protein
MRLYELALQYKSLEALEASEELPSELIRDTLEALQGDIEEKSKAVAMFIGNLRSAGDAIHVAADAMRVRGATLHKRAESLEAYLLLQMQTCGITKVECPYFTLARKANPPAVIIDHADSIPEEFWNQPEAPPKVIDKKAIAKAIKAGVDVPGAHAERRERLEIKQ